MNKVRAFTLVEIMVVVVIIGLLAALAVPTFVKIRATSQDKAVTNNLRQLLFAADQYYLESGNTTVRSVELVGTNTTQYIKVIEVVARETYSAMLTQATPITASNVAGQRTVTYTN
jgi:type IV pilus assembly protein PilA